jgi:glycerophosphoryl diester phosphodiesterase
VLIAHRGYALRYPENTLAGIGAAFTAGACYVEFDVQLCADRVPVLMHDESLRRTTGLDGSVLETPLDQLRTIEVSERERLGEEFRDARIPTLAEAVELIASRPRGEAFVEIKRESLARFGLADTVNATVDALRPAADRLIVISFDREAIRRARELGAPRIGWVLDQWSAAAQSDAESLGPDFLFSDRRLLPPGEALWRGPWRWAVYEVTDPDEAVELADRGVELVETMALREMLADPRLAPAACR